MTSIYPYQTQEVRDLAWACFSPPLLHLEQLEAASGTGGCALQLTAARRMWLEQLDRDASALLAHLAQRPTHRLGLYFEHLWHFFLEQDPQTKLLAHNLPIHAEGRTLGEFDCIYFCQLRQRPVHLELAVKYFLGARDTTRGEAPSEWREWLGPDTADRLDLKLSHLLSRQIRLGDQPIARQCLLELGIEEPLKEIALKGYLFQPLTDPLTSPMAYNYANHLHSWVTRSQLPAALELEDARRFLVLPKQCWLSQARWEPTSGSINQAELLLETRQRLERDTYPLLVAALDEYGWESNRFFVTPDGWPLSMSKGDDRNSAGQR